MIDLGTLLVVLTLTSAVLAASTLLVAARTERLPGLATWGWGLVANALSNVAFGLRLVGWPEASIVASNVLTPWSMVLFVLALLQFRPEAPSARTRALLWTPVVIGALAGTLLLEAHEARNLVAVTLHAYLMLLLAWVAWRPPPGKARFTGRALIMAGAVAMAAVSLWRAAAMLGTSEWPTPVFVPPHVQVATYLVVLVALLTTTMGFVLMQMERAVVLQRELAARDPLTGTHNRRALFDALAQLASQSRRHGRPLAALMIDIDHFKRVNDTHGHASGDAVLQEVGRRLHARLRRHDVLARFGGEEFVLLLPDTDQARALVVAEDLRSAVKERPMTVGPRTDAVSVTVSIGVHACIAGDGPDEPDRLLAACDAALYRAKARGRDRVEASA